MQGIGGILSASDVSIIISSKDRQSFVKSMLLWFEYQKFSGEVVVVDASDDPYDETFLDYSTDGLNFNLRYLHQPKSNGETIAQSMNRAYKRGLQESSREFAVLTCDDDYLTTNFLQKAVEILKEDKNICSVAADRVMVPNKPSSAQKFRERFFMNHQLSRNLFDADALLRIESFLMGEMFHTMFCVARVEIWRDVIPDHGKFQFPHFEADFKWILGIVARGPVAALAQPGIFSLKHEQNLSSGGNYASWGEDNPDWTVEKTNFREWLFKTIRQKNAPQISHSKLREKRIWDLLEEQKNWERKKKSRLVILNEWTKRSSSKEYSSRLRANVKFIRKRLVSS